MSAIETIDTAAIKWNGRVWSVPRPGRHCDVFRAIWAEMGEVEVLGGTQGFVTSTGRFTDRKEGMNIAKAAGQLERGKFQPNTLFSEDLW